MNNSKQRVIAYIDGSNLYFGMVDAGLKYCKWLDVKKLMESFLDANQELVAVKFFTSRLTHNEEKEARQATYLAALALTGVDLIFGSYHNKTIECYHCNHTWVTPTEKMTDVNLATHLLMDAHLDAYDVAFVVTGDTDFAPCVEAVNESYDSKSVVMLFPPLRENDTLEDEARSSQLISKEKLIECQLPMQMLGKDGIELHKPAGW
ncbi:MAG: NYN domain-containing protein [Bacteroidota bacterium]